MIPTVTSVKAQSDFKLLVRFKGKPARLFDMKPYLSKGVFKELRDNAYFNKVRVVWGGVGWPHEQDLSAETLYNLGATVKRSTK